MALRHALSSKAKAGSLIVLDNVVLTDPKTAGLRATFDKMGLKNALVIAGPEVDGNFKLAARNIPNIDVLPNAGLNVYDVLRRHTLVLTKDAVDAISARFAEKEAA
jgi:large subunit ribosomal protein L4